MKNSFPSWSLGWATSYLKRRNFLWQMMMGTGFTLGHWGCRPTQSIAHLRIGINDWIGYAIARYTQKTGIFEKRGLQVDFIEFINLQDATRAMLRGGLDATFSTTWDLLQAGLPNEQPVLLLICDISNGSDGIAARPPLTTMNDLQGKRIGVKLGTINELILLEALSLHGISSKKIKILDVSNQIAANQLRENLIDAAVLWQPLLEQTAQAIQGSIVYTTKDQPSLVIDVLATREQLFQEKQDAFTRFLWAWFDTMAILEKSPSVIFNSLTKILGYSTVDLIQAYAGVKPGTLALNRQFFGENKRIKQSLKDTLNLLAADENYSQTVRPDLVIPANFILQAIEQWQNPP